MVSRSSHQIRVIDKILIETIEILIETITKISLEAIETIDNNIRNNNNRIKTMNWL